MSNGPYGFDVEEGIMYAWCTCGLSQKQPLCDGTHRGRTEKKSLKWIAPKTERVYFCGCKETKNSPLCDGSHLNSNN